MHILFLTDNFPPEVNAPASRTFEHSREWVKNGHKVTVITCVPNFPSGRLFKGYKNKLFQSEIIEGIRVIRVWTYIAANIGVFRRSLDHMSFMVAAVSASVFLRKPDVIIGTSPQFFTVCAAYMVSLFKKVPWVFELRDLWPKSIRVIGLIQNNLIIRILRRIEHFLYRNAIAIISVTYGFKSILIRQGIRDKKIFVVTNGVDLKHFRPKKILLNSYEEN